MQRKTVKLHSCRERPVWPGGTLVGSAFRILDLTFQGHWHISRVRRQPLCSGSFVRGGSHSSFANRMDCTIEVVEARSQTYPKLFFQAVLLILRPWKKLSLKIRHLDAYNTMGSRKRTISGWPDETTVLHTDKRRMDLNGRPLNCWHTDGVRKITHQCETEHGLVQIKCF